MKKSVKEKIIDSAIELFSKQWYETVSVAEICRNAGLSNGAFYNYFKNKQELFEFLLENLLDIFKKEFYNFNGNTTKEKLISFFEIVFEAASKYKPLVTIFREGQYRFPKYEKKLRDIYIDTLGKILEKDINEVDYIYIIGSLRFLAIMSSYGWVNLDKDVFYNLIFKGIFEGEIEHDIFNKISIEECVEEELNTKQLLINAGIELFSQKGFHKVKIFEITNHVNLAVGTFYIYFSSKEEFLREIVKQISHKTRLFISKNIPNNLNRLEKEIIGIYLFLHFFSKNRNYYEIIRESEFVVNDEVKNYYKAFLDGYLENIENVKYNNNEMIAMFLMGISHYTGIEYLFENTIKDKNNFLLSLSNYLKNGINMI